MRGTAKCFDDLRAYCESVPIVDCHDHSGACGPKHEDPVGVIFAGYFHPEALSCLTDDEAATVQDSAKSLDERWPLVEKAWKRARYTGYGQVTRRVLKHDYDADDLTLDVLKAMVGRMPDYSDPATFESVLEEAHIAARIEDCWPDVGKILDGTLEMTPRGRLAISLPQYHTLRDFYGVQGLVGPLKRKVTSLDEYVDACREIFDGAKAYGAVCFKDQSAYSRSLDYGNPSRAAAEEIFNWLMADPRRSAGYPDRTRPLDDWLFHQFLRMAHELHLPVQIHTGHMAGIRNDIAKTNAVHLTRVLELHQDVRFDLFHANWPYGEELLFLGKNYPNVHLDFCWANIIDPLYCQDLLKKVLSSVPHGKVHGFGADFGPDPERSWAHADIARDNIAIALSDLIDLDYIDLDDARQIARMWLFENPNAFFRLGLEA